MSNYITHTGAKGRDTDSESLAHGRVGSDWVSEGPTGYSGFALPGSALVDGLSASTQLAQPEGAQSQLQVLGDLAALGQDLKQPLLGHLGEAEVADGGPGFRPHVAPARGWDVALSVHYHFVLPRVQQPPVVSVVG